MNKCFSTEEGNQSGTSQYHQSHSESLGLYNTFCNYLYLCHPQTYQRKVSEMNLSLSIAAETTVDTHNLPPPLSTHPQLPLILSKHLCWSWWLWGNLGPGYHALLGHDSCTCQFNSKMGQGNIKSHPSVLLGAKHISPCSQVEQQLDF